MQQRNKMAPLILVIAVGVSGFACQNPNRTPQAEASGFSNLTHDMGLNFDQTERLRGLQEKWTRRPLGGRLSDPLNRAELAAQFRTITMDPLKVRQILNSDKTEASVAGLHLAESLSQFHHSLNIQQRELMATRIENGDLK